jgi:putative FmdB family regulatory protein
MPLYAFTCKDCNHSFESLVRAADTEAPTCPSCNSAALEQMVSKICVEIKYPAIAKSWRRKAAAEGDLSNFSKEELKGKF